MATRRTPLARAELRGRITHEAIEAYRAGDDLGLHRALGLNPWECSPLPLEVTPLGVDQGPPPKYEAHPNAWAKAQELQRELEKAVKR